MVSSFDFSASLAGFQSEAREGLDRIQEGLLTAEAEEADDGTFSQLRQQAHDIQESADRLGLADLREGAEALEEGVTRLGRGELGSQGFDALLGLHATLRDAVERLRESDRKGIDTAYWQRGMAEGEGAPQSGDPQIPATEPAGETAATAVETRPPVHLTAPSPEKGTNSPLGRPDGYPDSLRISADGLERLAENVAALTRDQGTQADRRADLDRIQASLRTLQQHWKRLETRLPHNGPLGDQRERVSHQLEELVQQVRQFQRRTDSDRVARNALYNELHQCVRELRIASLGAFLAILPQSVRDLAQRFQKRVEITVADSEVELERAEGEALFDSLVHLASQVIAHSIETPEERRAVGKDPVGHIRIGAEPTEEELILSLSDDGRGLEMSPVRETGQWLSGSLQVASEGGKGTTLTLKVPLPRSPDERPVTARES